MSRTRPVAGPVPVGLSILAALVGPLLESAASAGPPPALPVASISAAVPTTPEYPHVAFRVGPGALGGGTVVADPVRAPAPAKLTVTLLEGGKNPVVATAPVDVTYTVTGTAIPGADYFVLPGRLTVPAGASSAEILLYAVEDSLFEGNESVVVILTAGPSSPYTVGVAGNSATATILDDDNRVSTELSVRLAEEAGQVAGRMIVRRIGPTSAPLPVEYDVSGTATPGADYTPLPGIVTIPAGAASAAIDVVPLPDAVNDEGETVVVTLRAGGRCVLGSRSSETVTIRDAATTAAPPILHCDIVPHLPIHGGETVAVHAVLVAVAPPNYVVTLSSDTAGVDPPASVPFTAGRDFVDFEIRTAPTTSRLLAANVALTVPGGTHTLRLAIVP